jgi:hypothetical protein
MMHVHSTPINTSCYAGVKESYILLQKDARQMKRKEKGSKKGMKTKRIQSVLHISVMLTSASDRSQ